MPLTADGAALHRSAPLHADNLCVFLPFFSIISRVDKSLLADAICSFLSYYFYHQALIFQLLRDCYEALVIASFFFLLVSYLSNPVPTPAQPHPQPFSTRAERNAQLRSVLKDLHFEKWAWPLGRWRWKPDGESFLWWMRVCVGQYVVVRPLSTLASVVGELTGHYCLASYSPKFVHVWSSAAVSISVTVAMYAVIQVRSPSSPCPLRVLLAGL